MRGGIHERSTGRGSHRARGGERPRVPGRLQGRGHSSPRAMARRGAREPDRVRAAAHSRRALADRGHVEGARRRACLRSRRHHGRHRTRGARRHPRGDTRRGRSRDAGLRRADAAHQPRIRSHRDPLAPGRGDSRQVPHPESPGPAEVHPRDARGIEVAGRQDPGRGSLRRRAILHRPHRRPLPRNPRRDREGLPSEVRDPRTEERAMKALEHVELVTGVEPRGTVIWMHGLGADGWDFVPIVRELPLPPDLALRFIFPHAPERAVTINDGYRMRAWYDISQSDLARVPDEKGIRESQGQIEELIAREHVRGMEASRIVLAGFSQGGAIALQAGLRHPARVGAIVALSSYLPLEDSLDREASAANKAARIFMAHGTQDPVVPLGLAERSREALRMRGYDVQWHAYPMPHSVCAEEVQDLASFLAGVYGAAPEKRSSILLP